MQTAFSFDEASLSKTYKGFAISAVGALLAGFVMIAPEVADWISNSDPINWRNALVAAWGAFSSGVVNALKQWMQGEPA